MRRLLNCKEPPSHCAKEAFFIVSGRRGGRHYRDAHSGVGEERGRQFSGGCLYRGPCVHP